MAEHLAACQMAVCRVEASRMVASPWAARQTAAVEEGRHRTVGAQSQEGDHLGTAADEDRTLVLALHQMAGGQSGHRMGACQTVAAQTVVDDVGRTADGMRPMGPRRAIAQRVAAELQVAELRARPHGGGAS